MVLWWVVDGPVVGGQVRDGPVVGGQVREVTFGSCLDNIAILS